MRQSPASLVASPVLVGAVTVLIAVIAVFIAYNANAGLPFVPTYDVKAELPSGAKLVKGNEVRTGGFRVGSVEEITPRIIRRRGREKAIAVVALKLDKTVEPLARDSQLRVRPRSALGLKYVELNPGRAKRAFKAGDTVPLENSGEPLDFEDVFSTFDRPTRPAIQEATAGFGDAFAGRGQALNTAVQSLNPLFRHLTPVMTTLADPRTELDELFKQIGRASAQVAPVAREQAQLFTYMGDTFAAISSDPGALQATIEKSPPTMDTAISSFRVQRPFLADFTDLSRRLRPAAAELPRALPALNTALRVGTPVLPKTVGMNERLEDVLVELDDLFENPNTLLALRDLRTTHAVLRPAAEYVAPYQSVCNYGVYFFNSLGEHMAVIGADKSGTAQNQGAKFMNSDQPNSYSTLETSRSVDVRPGQHPRGAKDEAGQPLHRKLVPEYPPAIDAQGNADCQRGQEGWPKGPFTTAGRYGRGAFPNGVPYGGNAHIGNNNYPILSGGTFKSRELGIDNLKDVP